jgi:MFS transporter, DHA1 family, tetracycline resistance protein
MQGLMSDKVDEDAQGELQGAVASMISLTSIVGPILMTRVFAHFSDDKGLQFPGAPFLLATVLALLGIGLYLIVTRRSLSR